MLLFFVRFSDSDHCCLLYSGALKIFHFRMDQKFSVSVGWSFFFTPKGFIRPESRTISFISHDCYHSLVIISVKYPTETEYPIAFPHLLIPWILSYFFCPCSFGDGKNFSRDFCRVTLSMCLIIVINELWHFRGKTIFGSRLRNIARRKCRDSLVWCLGMYKMAAVGSVTSGLPIEKFTGTPRGRWTKTREYHYRSIQRHLLPLLAHAF